MKKYNGIPGLKEIFRGSGTSCSGGEIVDISYGLILERNGGSSRSDEDDAAAGGGVAGYEFVREGEVGF